VCRELEDDDHREAVGEEEEPFPGSFHRMTDQRKSYRHGCCEIDCEVDNCDRERRPGRGYGSALGHRDAVINSAQG